MKQITFIASSITLLLLIYGATSEYLTPDWKSHQSEYSDFVTGRGKSFEVTQRQLVLPHLDKIDRCVICHVGIMDPAAAELDNPLRTHPGNYLDKHDPSRFGCTICHDGQGRATTFGEAVGHDAEFWEEPALLPPFLEANCARCHRTDMPRMSGAWQRGERLFAQGGCQGCHKVRGKGGALGPELTTIGQASFHLKRPVESHAEELIDRFNGNVNLAFIYEAVYQPKIQPDSSQMIDYGFTEQQAMDLTVFLKSLQEYTLPDGMIVASGEVARTGRDLYSAYCSACHGADGRGTNLTELGGKIGPALGNEQFLAITDHSFLTAVISGSGSSIMPAWGGGGGMADDEIARIADYVIAMRDEPPAYGEVAAEEGVVRFGNILFNGNCAGCHGIDGDYEIDMIGPTLRSPQLLSLMDRRKFYETMVDGRAGTAMPTWGFLSNVNLADLMAYTDSWREDVITRQSFNRAVAGGSASVGRRLFYENCAACHGDEAEGGLGPSLKSREFLKLADNRFLYGTLTEGRRGTAMAEYNYLGAKTLGDIVAYLRSEFKGTIAGTDRKRIQGSEFNGQKLYARVCAQCHGDDGSGYVGPAIASEGFLANATDRFIWETAAYGRSGSPMKGNLRGQNGTADLSKQELNDIVAFIRTYEENPPNLAGRSTVPGEHRNGRDDFARLCAQCHGDGGGGGNGPAIGREGFLDQISDGFVVAMMMSGRDGTEMKKFGRGGLAELDANTAAGIVNYLRTRDESEVGPKYVIGTPQMGEEIYVGQCGQCHDKGSFAPDLKRPSFIKAASVGYLQATMTLGRHQSAMRSMVRGGGGLTELTGKDINDIIAYLQQGKE